MTESEQKDILAGEQQIKDLSERLGSDHPDVASAMLGYATALRSTKRLLDAANWEARAKVILSKNRQSRDSRSSVDSELEPHFAKQSSESSQAVQAERSCKETCLFCRRKVVTVGRRVCRFCCTCGVLVMVGACRGLLAVLSGEDPRVATFLFLLLLVYFAPTMIAAYKNKFNVWLVGAINLVLGAMGWIGWVLVFVVVLWAEPLAVLCKLSPAGDEVACNFCLEPVRKGAKICKHCRSDLGPGAGLE